MKLKNKNIFKGEERRGKKSLNCECKWYAMFAATYLVQFSIMANCMFVSLSGVTSLEGLLFLFLFLFFYKEQWKNTLKI